MMSVSFPEPTSAVSSRVGVLVGYLDYFRDQTASTIEGLPEHEQRTSRLPSAWTPLQLLKHLTHVEQRWLEWGFEGTDLVDPWGDTRDGHWFVDDADPLVDLLVAFRRQTARSNAVIMAHSPEDVGQPGPRWSGCCCTCSRSMRDTWATSTSWPSSLGGRLATEPGIALVSELLGCPHPRAAPEPQAPAAGSGRTSRHECCGS